MLTANAIAGSPVDRGPPRTSWLIEKELETERDLGRREDLLDRHLKYQNQVVAEAEQSWREQMQETEGRHKAMIHAMAGNYRQLKNEREKALDDRRHQDELGAIYGHQSAAVTEVEDLRRQLAAARAMQNDAARVTGGAEREKFALLERFGLASGGSRIYARSPNGSTVTDPDTGDFVTDGKGRNVFASAGSFAEDMETFARWLKLGVELTDSAGRPLTEQDFFMAMEKWTAADQVSSESSQKGAAASKEEAKLLKDLDRAVATIRAGARQTAKDLEIEADVLEAQLDPSKAREARMKQLEAQIKARRDSYVQAGILGPSADPGDAAKIEGSLDRIAELMRQQVDGDSRITEANPLPVKVVELPRVFALPSSAYFRDRDPARLSIAKLEINGSGLDEAALQRATQRAIVGASYEITDGVFREKHTRDEQLKV